MSITQKDAILAVSVVLYRSDTIWLERTFRSLSRSLSHVLETGVISAAHIVLVDNEASSRTSPHFATLQNIAGGLPHVQLHELAGHGNVGFGAANNLAFASVGKCEFLLILNPDVIVDEDAIRAGIAYLAAHDDCVMVTPCAKNPAGMPLYLARRTPAVALLALRGFAPLFVRLWFDRYLACDEFRGAGDPSHDEDLHDAETASGCFMLLRGKAFRGVAGFDERFFLYFEDFDLSLRLRKHGAIARVGGCNIVHNGGGTARKGVRHIWLFTKSAVRFFHKHGWRLW
jgi:hypothetical protein